MTAIIIFSVATIINVTLSTIRSICTIKCGKWWSAITNAICYGFYPLIVMLTAKDTVSIIVNMAITAVANFVCVWIIKYIEEKSRKDKMWKVEMAIPLGQADEVIYRLKHTEDFIPFNYNFLGKWCVLNCYCATQEETAFVRDLAKNYNGKISAYESQKLY
jgi:hypothetical protein